MARLRALRLSPECQLSLARLGLPLGAPLPGFPFRSSHIMVLLARLLQAETLLRFRVPHRVFANPLGWDVYPPTMGQRTTGIAFLLVCTAFIGACSSGDGPSSSPAPPPPPGLALRASGIGSYDVGLPAELVIEGISSQIGGSDADSTEPDSSVIVPDCGVASVRLVSWGNLVLFFSGEEPDSPFLTWSYGFDPVTASADDVRRLGLVTDEGIGLGSPRADVERAYRGRIVILDDTLIDVSTFTIDGDEAEHLTGRFPTTDPDEAVQYLERAPACSPFS